MDNMIKPINIKIAKFKTEVIIDQHLVKAISKENASKIQMHDNYVSFEYNNRLYFVPFSNISIIEK